VSVKVLSRMTKQSRAGGVRGRKVCMPEFVPFSMTPSKAPVSITAEEFVSWVRMMRHIVGF